MDIKGKLADILDNISTRVRSSDRQPPPSRLRGRNIIQQEADRTLLDIFSSIFPDDTDMNRPFSDAELTQLYESIPWIRIAVDKRANDYSALPYKIMRTRRNGDQIDVTDQYPVFNCPMDDGTTGYEFRKILMTTWLITGKIFLEKVGFDDAISPRSGAGRYGLYPHDSRYVTPQRTDGRYVNEYLVYDGIGRQRVLTNREIIYKRMRSYTSEVDSAPILNSARRELQKKNRMDSWNINYFDNATAGNRIYVSKDGVSEEAYKRWEQQNKNNKSGSQNAGKDQLLENIDQVVQTTDSMRDSGYQDGERSIMLTLLSMFGVPASLVDASNANRSNVTEFTRFYWTSTQMPDILLFDAMFSSFLPQNERFTDRYVTDFTSIPELQKDRTKQSRELSTQYADNAITLNEYRVKVGQPMVDGGDVFRAEWEQTLANRLGVEQEDGNPIDENTQRMMTIQKEMELVRDIASILEGVN